LRSALAALAVLAVLGLIVWWGRGEESARTRRAATPDAVTAGEETKPGAAEPAPAPEAPPLPPDPVDRGHCAVLLRVLDAETEQPVASTVDLWRLDAPGNEHWTAGDQLQATAEVPVEGVTLEDLPAGVYRPVCLAERYCADDPPPVRIEGPLTEITFRIAVPRQLYAYVKVVDLRGVPVPTGGVRGGSSRRWGDRTRTPAWSRPRAPRKGEAVLILGGGGGGGGSRSSLPPKQIPQPAEGFRLGPFREDAKKSAVRHLYTIEIEGCTKVLVSVPGVTTDGSTFLGLSVPLATVPGDLRMPDGRTIAEAGGKVSATFIAVALDASAPAPPLSGHPFHIYVTVPGFKDLSFEHRLGEPVPSLAFEAEAEAEAPTGR